MRYMHYIVWMRWEDTKAVTTEKIKSLTPLFEGDQITVDDKIVTLMRVDYKYSD